MNPASLPAITVVLVHGAWADASSWHRVIRRLQADGIAVVAVQNPTTSLSDDVAATRRAIDQAAGPVVLVGHSWGGTVITEAGVHESVKALVYVAAFAPEVGQSTGDLVGLYPAPPALSAVKEGLGHALLMTEAGWLHDVAQDLPAEEARVLAATAPPLPASTFGEAVSEAAWASRPTWYVVSTQDRAVDVGLQRALANKMKADVTELGASHMSLLSKPDEVAAVIRSALRAVA